MELFRNGNAGSELSGTIGRALAARRAPDEAHFGNVVRVAICAFSIW
jgi:hypothetical protein